MRERKTPTRAEARAALIRKRAAAAIPLTGFALAVALFAASAVRIAKGGSAAAELFSLGFPLAYPGGREIRAEDNASEYSELPSPILVPQTDVDSGVSNSVRIELLQTETAERAPIDLSGEEPRILIYHTHATEAYFPAEGEEYAETSPWRTADESRSVIAVGEKLADLLRNKYGISVIHDTTNHEPPKLSTAYSRSVKTMEQYKEEYPSITMFIDLHRDAYGNDPKEKKDYLILDGKEVARMMFVVGTGEGATGTGFGEKPDFAANYALAKKLTEYLLQIDAELMRNIRVKTGRYNQHVSNQCLLVEVGHNANTLTQALNAVEYLAQAIAKTAEIGNAAPEAAKTPLPLAP